MGSIKVIKRVNIEYILILNKAGVKGEKTLIISYYSHDIGLGWMIQKSV